MNKPLLYTIGVMALLLFVWWLSGGTIIYGLNPAVPPVVEATAFIFRNFQVGSAFILNSLLNLFNR